MKKQKGLTIRKMKEILRLYFGLKLTQSQTAKSLNISKGVVCKYVNKAKSLNISWPLPDGMTDHQLASSFSINYDKEETIDFATIHKQKQVKAVTLMLLWEEYTEQNNALISYSQFCRRYKKWLKQQPQSMKQFHKAGEKIFVDYSGLTMDIIDPETSEVRSAEIFVGVLGLSLYTYAEATWTQQTSDWISSHIRMFEYFGGVSQTLVPDNLKSAVIKANRYDPNLNAEYYNMASHYSSAIIPARAYKPKDKAKAEGAVCLVQRWILARLREQTFVGLDELNSAIKKLLLSLNSKSFKKKEGSRKSWFEKYEKQSLKPLPDIRYVYKSCKKSKVDKEYHIQLNGHFYSVPFKYIDKYVDVLYNNDYLCCYYHGELIAEHLISNKYGKTTLDDHMPKSHLKHSKSNSKEGLIYKASTIGENAVKLIEKILESMVHEEQSYRACQSILSLTKKYTKNELELACEYAYNNNILQSRSIKNIMESDVYKLDNEQPNFISIEHSNIRGSNYYH